MQDDDNDEEIEIFQRSDLFPLHSLDDNDNDIDNDRPFEYVTPFDTDSPQLSDIIDSEGFSQIKQSRVNYTQIM